MPGTGQKAKTYRNFVGGEWVDSGNGGTYEVRDPGRTGDAVGRFPLSTAEDVRAAVEAAHEAFGGWRRVPAPERGDFVHGFMGVLGRRGEELAEAMTLEMGKPIGEARGEVGRALSEARFTAGEALRVGGRTLPSARRDLLAYTLREPLGVVTAITPWNFPVVSPLRKLVPALVAGCTVVLKPASQTPLSAVMIHEMLEEAGLPAGVANLVLGRGGEIGDALVAHPLVRGVTFTGSTEVGLGIYQKAAANNAKVQLEMGGKNAAVVAECADVAGAAAQIVPAAYQATGQRCTSISRVIVLKEQQAELEAALVEEVEKLNVGHGLDAATTIGPLSSRSQLERSERYVELAKEDGARVLAGGGRPAGDGFDEGYYYEPTVLTDVGPGSAAATDEIFGPVLLVIPVETFAEALAVNNEVAYGLTSAIFTGSMAKAQAFVENSEAGMVHVNNGTISEANMPFGGVKQSGMGAYSIGETNEEFYTNLKVVYHQHRYGEGDRPSAPGLMGEGDPA